MTKILEFLRLKIPPNPQKRKYKTNSKIPYRDPRVKPEDDIVGNSRIPTAKTRIPKDKSRIPLKTQIKQENSRFLRGFRGDAGLGRSPYNLRAVGLAPIKRAKI